MRSRSADVSFGLEFTSALREVLDDLLVVGNVVVEVRIGYDVTRSERSHARLHGGVVLVESSAMLQESERIGRHEARRLRQGQGQSAMTGAVHLQQ